MGDNPIGGDDTIVERVTIVVAEYPIVIIVILFLHVKMEQFIIISCHIAVISIKKKVVCNRGCKKLQVTILDGKRKGSTKLFAKFSDKEKWPDVFIHSEIFSANSST